MSFVWFWTFWHWSTESWRAGVVLDGPVHGMAGHWDEWYRHEASPADRREIEAAGRTPESQRRFVSWLVRRWAADAAWRGERPPVRLVLAQLATLAPFDRWAALARYRAGWHVPGVSAVVIGEDSDGAAEDVRRVEALCVPADPGTAHPAVVADGFRAEPSELAVVRTATRALLGGRGLATLLALWLAAGRRPYPRAVALVLGAGWLAAAALLARLLLGPDPGVGLHALVLATLALWTTLLAIALVTGAVAAAQAWRRARALRERLDRSRILLRMDDGLTLVGGSAGLAFVLNTLAALLRESRRERGARARSWLWRRVARRMHDRASAWAATGIVADDGRVLPVVLAPKLRAALRHTEIAHLLAPWQSEATPRRVAPLAESLHAALHESLREARAARPHGAPRSGAVRVGFASSRHALASHRCRHVAQAVLSVGGLWSGWQAAANVLALAVSAVVLLGLGDLRALLLPPPVPAVVAPTSTSPYHLWVSLDTRHADDFAVVLESGFWANRRVRVAAPAAGRGPARAELPLARRRTRMPHDLEDGTVWIERRHAFLFREYAPGARVGSYSLAWVMRLGD